MANQTLSAYLKQIGLEHYASAHVGEDGCITQITNDEMLARRIWARAHGWRQDVRDENGHLTGVIDHPPDPKAQEFIFERREGKSVVQVDKKTADLLDKISELAKIDANDMAEQSVNDE